PRRLRQRPGHARRRRRRGPGRVARRPAHRPRPEVRGRLRHLPGGRAVAAAGPVRSLLTRRRLAPALGVALALAVLAFPLAVTGPFPRHVMIMVFLYGTLASAWNILAGYC